MPETRLAKARRSLPEGYQFGDAADRLDYLAWLYFGHARAAAGRLQLAEWIDAARLPWPSFDAAMREVDLRSRDQVSDTETSR